MARYVFLTKLIKTAAIVEFENRRDSPMSTVIPTDITPIPRRSCVKLGCVGGHMHMAATGYARVVNFLPGSCGSW